VAPLRGGAAVHRPGPPSQDHLLDLRSQEHASNTGDWTKKTNCTALCTDGGAAARKRGGQFGMN
jgi:hypothetical protein